MNHAKHLRLTTWALAASLTALLTACGGGDGGGRTQVVDALAGDSDAPACSSCSAGVLTGTAAIGRPLAGALVVVHGAGGPVGTAKTDAAGRYRVEFGSGAALPQGALVVEVTAEVAGQVLVLHNLQSAEETRAGRRALHLTPLTELIAADVLGASPQSLLARGEVDWRRVSARALRDAESRVQALAQPVLDAAEVPATVDLRSSAFDADGLGVDAALDLLSVQAERGGWQVAWKAGPGAGEARFFDPASPSAQSLPTAAQNASALQLQLVDATTGVRSLLAALTARFANGMPAASDLAPLLTASFRHAGLDAAAYVQVVWLREDAVTDGSYSLVDARFEDPHVVQQLDADHALVRFVVRPRAPFAARTEAMWVARGPSGWQLQGDGRRAAVAVRHALILGPRPASEQQVQQLHGAECVAEVAALSGRWCSTAGGQAGVSAGGTLEFGDPAQTAFGTLAVFRLAAGSVAAQRQAAAAGSRYVGTPSDLVRHYLVFEVDARQIDPAVATVRVRGGALPAGGIDLVAPAYTVNGPASEHWTLAVDEDAGWAGLPWGWCATDADAPDCAAAWAAMRSGSTLFFDLLDGSGQVLQTQAAVIPAEPPLGVTAADLRGRFARFDLSSSTADQPLYARVMADAGNPWSIDWPWQRPLQASAPNGRADLAWHRADLGGGAGEEVVRRHAALDASANGRVNWTLPARAGWAASWLSVRLTATDRLGVQHIHFLAPSNPY